MFQEQKDKLVIIFALAALAVVNGREHCLGCPGYLDFQDAKHILKASLSKLASLEGPQYTFGKIHSASHEIIAGIRYKINVDLIDTDKTVEACDVEIEIQAATGNTQVSFKCPSKPDVVESYKTQQLY